MKVLKIDEWIQTKNAQFEPEYMFGTLVMARRLVDDKKFELFELVYDNKHGEMRTITGFSEDYIHVEFETLKVPINNIRKPTKLEQAANSLAKALGSNVSVIGTSIIWEKK